MHDMVRGAILQLEGKADEACRALQKGIEGVRVTGAEVTIPGFQVFLTDALRESGRVEEAWQTVEDGMDRIARNGGRFAEIDLLLAKSRLITDGSDQAGELIERAITAAREFSAPILELRAVLALARLRADRGDAADRDLVVAALSRIREGVDSQDVRDAHEFLARGAP